MKFKMHDLKLVWYFFKPYKVQMLGLLIVMTISGFMEMLNLAMLYPVVNNGLKLQNNNLVLRVFNDVIQKFTTDNYFFVSCVFLIIVTIIAIIFKFIYNFAANRLMTKIVGDTQKDIFDQYLTADYGFFIKNKQGKLIHAGTIAPERVTNIVLFSLRLVYDLLNSLFLFSLLTVLTWHGTALLAVIGCVYGLFVKQIIRHVIYHSSTIATEEERKKNVILNEFISGVKTIKIFSTFDDWKNKYIEAVDRSLYHRFRMLMGRVFPDTFMKFIFFIMIAILGMILSYKSQPDLILAVPMFATFAAVASRFFPSIQMLGNDLMGITDSIPNARIVYDLCTANIKSIPDGDKTLTRFDEKIDFKNVWFKYDDMHEWLLKDVSFEIRKKQLTAIVGSSGSGKTTIVNLLLRLYLPDEGLIGIDGKNIFDYTEKSYLGKVGYVSQETFIFHSTIKENIRFGMKNCTDEMIEAAAKLANAHEFITNMRNGYDTVVGDLGLRLSGGQRQRVAIARAMLRNPEILILDEATSSLDNIAEKNVQEAIKRVASHTTVVVVAHRLSTICEADKIVVLKEGTIREEGTHEQLMGNNGLYFDLYTKQDALV